MSEQQRYEVIVALAHGTSPGTVAEAMDMTVMEVREIQALCNFEIQDAREKFEKGGYFYGNDY